MKEQHYWAWRFLCLRGLCLIAPVCVLPWSALGNPRNDQLLQVAETVDTAYVRVRDELLRNHPEQWDVLDASQVSWRAGLQAFILNARLKAPAVFAIWDKLQPKTSANMQRNYRLDGGPAFAQAAFRIEKVWKGLTERERSSAFAYGNLPDPCDAFAHTAITAMWQAVWNGTEHERLRYYAAFHLGAAGGSSCLPLLSDLLTRNEPELKRFQARAISGMAKMPTDESAELILDAWDNIESIGLVRGAIAVLVANKGTTARQRVYAVIRSPEMPETLRTDAIGLCCKHSLPADATLFGELLAQSGSVQLRRNAIKTMSACPLDRVRTILTDVIRSSDEAPIIAQAMLALVACYAQSDVIQERATSNDMSLLRSVQAREDLPTDTRAQASRHVQQLEKIIARKQDHGPTE